jgi:hypothetical protein
MQTFDELLFLHPASVIARLAAEPSPRQRKRTEKSKPEELKQPLLLRLAAWGGMRKGGKRAGARQYDWSGERPRAQDPAASVVRPANARLGPLDPTGQGAT